MDNKKNTILLTVIAVATLLVAVVGATFAYFTAQGGAAAEAKVTVTTGTAASTTFGTYSAIEIYADQTNFAQNGDDISKSSTGTVSWTAPGATVEYKPTEDERSMCYKVEFVIDENTFVKSSTNTESLNELEYSVTKTPKNGTETALVSNASLVDLTTGVGKTGTLTISEEEKITADAGATNTVDWKITVTLKNLNVDQNDNTGKSFAGAVKFTGITCSKAQQ